jgi:hypothetical protein
LLPTDVIINHKRGKSFSANILNVKERNNPNINNSNIDNKSKTNNKDNICNIKENDNYKNYNSNIQIKKRNYPYAVDSIGKIMIFENQQKNQNNKVIKFIVFN